eukprot:gene24553-33016_t
MESHLLESIRVCVKIFPSTHRKVKESSPTIIDGNARFPEKRVGRHCISVVDEKRLQILPVNSCSCDQCKRKNNCSTSNNVSKNKAPSPDLYQKIFQFDHVLNQLATQAELFECVKENIETLFCGISSTIVSFGPSGSGKTYMMKGEGKAENIGLIQRSIRAVFDHISRECCGQFTVELSYIELAKNCFNNLLSTYISNAIAKKSPCRKTPERFASPSSRSRSVSQAEHSIGRSPSRSPGPHFSKRSPSPLRVPGGDSSTPGAEGAEGLTSVDERLELHSSPTGAAFFTGPRSAPTISQIQVGSEQEAMEAILAGDKQLAHFNRRAGHLVISLHLMKIEPGAKSVQQATLQLVDLAVAGDRSDPGQSLTDGGDIQFINRSMLALNEVLKRLAVNTERVGRVESSGGFALSDSVDVDGSLIGACSSTASISSSSSTCSSPSAIACNLHVPYMDSKLTMMLRDSLGGATRAVLVTSLQLESSQFQQNLNTLEAVSRAGKVLKNICSGSSGCVESPVIARMSYGNSPSHKRLLNLALSPEHISSPPRVHHSHIRDRSRDRTNIQLSKLLSSTSVEDPTSLSPPLMSRAYDSLNQSLDQRLVSNSPTKFRSTRNQMDMISNPIFKVRDSKNMAITPDGIHSQLKTENEELTSLPISLALLRNSVSPTSISPGKCRRSPQAEILATPAIPVPLDRNGFGRTRSTSPCKTQSSLQNESSTACSQLSKTRRGHSYDSSHVRTSPDKTDSRYKEKSAIAFFSSRSCSPPNRSRDREVLDLYLDHRSRMSPRRPHTPSKLENETGSPSKVSPSISRVGSATRLPEDPKVNPISHRDHVRTSPDKADSSRKEKGKVALSSSRSCSPPNRSRDREVLDLNLDPKLDHRSRMSPRRPHTSSKLENEAGSPSKVSPSISRVDSATRLPEDPKLENEAGSPSKGSPSISRVGSATRLPEDPKVNPISVDDVVLGIAESGRGRHNMKSSLSVRYAPPCSPHSLVSPKTRPTSTPCSLHVTSPTAEINSSPNKENVTSPPQTPVDGKVTPPHSSARVSTTPQKTDSKSPLSNSNGGRTSKVDGYLSNEKDDGVQKSSKTTVRIRTITSPRRLPSSPTADAGAKSSILDTNASGNGSEKLGSREEILPIWQKKTATSLWREEDERRQKEQRGKEKPRSISPSARQVDNNGSFDSPNVAASGRRKRTTGEDREAVQSPTLDSTYPDESPFEGSLMQKIDDLHRKSCEDINFQNRLPLEEPQSVISSENVAAVSQKTDGVDEINSCIEIPKSACLDVEIKEQQQLQTITPSKGETRPVPVSTERVSLGDSQLKSTELLDRHHMDNSLLKKKVEALRNAFWHIDQKLQVAAKDPKFSTELFSQSDEMITRCVLAKSESYEVEKELDSINECGMNRFATEKAWRKSLEKECACLKDLMKLEKIVSQCVDSRDAPIAKSVMKSLMKLLETCDRLRNEICEVRMQVEAEYASLLDGKDHIGLLREELKNFMGVYDCFDDGNKKLLQLLAQEDEKAQLLESFREKMRQALVAEMQRQEMESQLMFTRMRRVKEENEADQQEIAEIEEERLAAAASLKRDYTEEARAGRAACMHSERIIKSLRSVRRELTLELEIMSTIANKIKEESAARTAANEIASSFGDLQSLFVASPITTKCNSPAVSIAKNNFLANLSTTMALTSPTSKTNLSSRAANKQKFTFDEPETSEKASRTEVAIENTKGGKVRVEHSPRVTVVSVTEQPELSDKENRPVNTSPRAVNLSNSTPEKRKTATSSPSQKDKTTAEKAIKPRRSSSSSNLSMNQLDALQVSQHGSVTSELRSLEASISEGKSLLEELMTFCEDFSDR